MQSRGWIVAAAVLVVSGCATQTEWDRGCDGNARWSYGILRVRSADRRADVEALYQDDGDGWRLVSVSSRGWPPDPND